MARKQAMDTGVMPLEFAAEVAMAANESFGDGGGQMMDAVTPVTRELLKYWFTEPFTNRDINFHEGQRQAILNVIYLHEVLKAQNPRDSYSKVAESLLSRNDGAVANELAKAKYGYPKYLVKMATGTGKTWVMHALLIWQYLNARGESGEKSGRWTRNFLLVAPGLIVYERLLDAFCGRRVEGGESRNFSTSDIKSAERLFVPPAYRDAVFSFLQNGVVRKEDFGRKVTGDGVLAVMNWHAFLGDDEIDDGAEEALDPDGNEILDDILPARPGVAAGNALESLDAQYLRGGRLDFLKDLPDLMLVNDEAHHVHGTKSADAEAVKWQQGIDLVAEGKGERFFQLDFSATPYEPSGTGNNQRKDYFPHVVADFDLSSAIRGGYVKTIVIDKRKSYADQMASLDYSAMRDGGRVVGLSDGQRVMLRAGLAKLAYLDGEFARFAENRERKHPKMMVVCEDTSVTPFVEEFLLSEGLAHDDILTIDSNRQGEIGEKEWQGVKGRLFAIDKGAAPKVVISVLMLREGFDVNNICVIVPLRASSAQILLEQTLGRGLRLMWREPGVIQDVKAVSRRQLLVDKVEPDAVLDLLYVIEHPAFIEFYDSYLGEDLFGVWAGEDQAGRGGSDIILATLKDDYRRYDLFWPVIMHESEDVLTGEGIGKGSLEAFTSFSLTRLKEIFARDGEVFVGHEMLVGTTFGEYRVNANLFNAECYNEYLQGIVNTIFRRFARVAGRQTRAMPALQINLAGIAGAIDRYVRNDLFGEPFDPFHGSDWKVLLCANGLVTEHIVRQIGNLVWSVESGAEKVAATVRKLPFSDVQRLTVRERFSLALTKTIYTRTGYPSHGGGLERCFLEFIDRDSCVERFVKVSEAQHTFARIAYLRSDGLMSEYIPDFLVATRKKTYIVETKGSDRVGDENVQRKRKAAVEWCKRVNALEPDDRMERTWTYVLLSDSDFYSYRDRGCTFKDMCKFAEVTESGLKGEFDFG